MSFRSIRFPALTRTLSHARFHTHTHTIPSPSLLFRSLLSSVDKNISNIAFTRTVLGLLVAIIVLAVDELNPVKLFLHVFPSIQPWHVATISVVSIVYVFLSEFKELLYFAVKIFINSMLSIFFRDIEVIGKDRLPRHGPMIFVINHANQFVDAMVVLGTCGNENFKVSYLMAEKSFQRPVIGDIASALDVVPVKRAQDDAIRGKGKITFLETQATGAGSSSSNGSSNDPPPSPSSECSSPVVVEAIETEDAREGRSETETETESKKNGDGKSNAEETAIRKLTISGTDGFATSAFRVGDKLRPTGTPTGVKVLEIIDETTCVVDATTVSDDDMETAFATTEGNSNTYDILKHVELHSIFEKVLDRLAMGGVFGIFPEGGSHDRTDLLPLKVGVALIAYSALERDGVSVPIVPVGLNYFRTHRWRGKCLVEYGDPVYIPNGSLKEFQKGGASKRMVCTNLLDRIKDSMRSVIVTMPDYDSLQVVHTARRLYQRNSEEGAYGGQEKQDLLRRFAVGYKILYSGTNDSPPKA